MTSSHYRMKSVSGCITDIWRLSRPLTASRPRGRHGQPPASPVSSASPGPVVLAVLLHCYDFFFTLRFSIDIYLQKFGGCQVVIIDKVILDGSEYLVQECLHGLVEVPGDAVQPVRLARVDLGRGRSERNFRSIKCKLINIEIGDQRCEASGGPSSDHTIGPATSDLAITTSV